MNKVVSIVIALVGSVGVISSIITTIMAVRFMELGRAVFYLTIAFLCLGITIWGIMNLPSKKS